MKILMVDPRCNHNEPLSCLNCVIAEHGYDSDDFYEDTWPYVLCKLVKAKEDPTEVRPVFCPAVEVE